MHRAAAGRDPEKLFSDQIAFKQVFRTDGFVSAVPDKV